MVRPTPQDTASSLRRALTLLDALSAASGELTMRELAAASGVPRSTTHRLVTELLAWGALERGERGVKLGIKLFELGALVPSQSTLAEAASPYLHTLAEVTRLTANLAVREGREIVYLDKIGSRTLRVPHSRLGGRGVVHATGLGKAMLAFDPPDEVRAYARAGLSAVTAHTVTDEAQLERQLAVVRRSGLAFDVEESSPGLFCVAAPIRDRGGRAIAAVSVTGATALAQAERFGSTVIATARAIERALQSAGTRPTTA